MAGRDGAAAEQEGAQAKRGAETGGSVEARAGAADGLGAAGLVGPRANVAKCPRLAAGPGIEL